MKRGYLSEYFEGVALKKLSAVEADLMRSHQHEFNGVAHLKALLGEAEGKVSYPTHFLYLSDQNTNDLSASGFLTWYDARERARQERQVMRWEYRLYFSDNEVSRRAAPGDLLFLAKQANGRLLALIVEQDSTIAHQLLWLFDLETVEQPGFAVKSAREVERQPLGFAARRVLEQIGIESRDEAPNYLEEMLVKFNG